VGVGSRDEHRTEAGASHFLEHLLFKGTSHRSAQDIAEAVDAVGGELNAFTAKDHTAFHIRVLADDVDLALDVLADIMWDPAFRPADVEAERKVILEELLMQGDDPEELVNELLAAALWPDHPLGREVLGDAHTITAMRVSDLTGFHAARYRPGVTVVAAAGALDHDSLVAGIADRWQASGKDGGGSRPARHAPAASPLPRTVQRRKTEQAHLAIGIPAMTRHDPDRHAASVLVQVLGGGAASRLFQEVRERRGLAYAVYAYRSGFDDTGIVGLYAGTAPGRAAETLTVITGELERLADGITPRELEVARGSITGSMALGLEDSGARMHRIGRAQLLHGRVPGMGEVMAAFDAVTVEDVARVASSLLGRPRSLAVVGPFSEKQVAGWG
jgi:predicted Zn-dependent peptidase